MGYVTHLQTLGLLPGTSPDEIRAAYRARVAEWMPEDETDPVRPGARRKLRELADAYRFLMERYGLEPVGVVEPDGEVAEAPEEPRERDRGEAESETRREAESETRREAESETRREAKPSPAPRRRPVSVKRTTALFAVVLLAVAAWPSLRSGDLGPTLSRWVVRAGEFVQQKAAAWSAASRDAPASAGGAGRAARSARGRFVESLPLMTKADVRERYGPPRDSASGTWRYAGFSILFQDDSLATVLVRDSVPPDA